MQRMSLRLVGKILSNKSVNREAFIRVIGSIWQVRNGVEAESVTDNVFVFHFKSHEDRKLVIEKGPWSCDYALLMLEIPVGHGTIEKMEFSQPEFWVQIHQVPLQCMTNEITWSLGDMIGEVLDIDAGALRDCVGKFLRVRVQFDINKNPSDDGV
ncbi:hypothetical protein Ddye_021258 [Dipteronia dyeriana]|uniref:DUF4283 domain-containing protein n=1 Tax=Dipteronia dyeriana TaxID=168575 RepID=A0AAD9U1R8_9ROSI|nr:hypothetical protein Ddye_021258 [Dipteronia dyeriana]